MPLTGHTALVPVQPIRLFGDPVLRARAAEVVDFDKELRNLVRDLLATMVAEGGAGLAAPQLGVSRQTVYRALGLLQRRLSDTATEF